jgi:hypothetical protein
MISQGIEAPCLDSVDWGYPKQLTHVRECFRLSRLALPFLAWLIRTIMIVRAATAQGERLECSKITCPAATSAPTCHLSPLFRHRHRGHLRLWLDQHRLVTSPYILVHSHVGHISEQAV